MLLLSAGWQWGIPATILAFLHAAVILAGIYPVYALAHSKWDFAKNRTFFTAFVRVVKVFYLLGLLIVGVFLYRDYIFPLIPLFFNWFRIS